MSLQPGRPHARPNIQWRRADQLDPKAVDATSKGADWLYMRLRRLVGIASVLPQRRASGVEMAKAMSTSSALLAPPPWVSHAWQCGDGVRLSIALADAVRAQPIVPDLVREAMFLVESYETWRRDLYAERAAECRRVGPMGEGSHHRRRPQGPCLHARC